MTLLTHPSLSEKDSLKRRQRRWELQSSCKADPLGWSQSPKTPQKYQEKFTQGQRWVFYPWPQSRRPLRSDLIGKGSQPHSEALPGSLGERGWCWHSEGHPAALLVLSVLQEPSDLSKQSRCHTPEQEVADGERRQKIHFENTVLWQSWRTCVSNLFRDPWCWL